MSNALSTPANQTDKRKKLSQYLWFVGRASTLHGPYSHEQLLKALAAGEFDPGDYCWRQGFNEWRSICAVDDFGFVKKPYIVKSYPEIPAPSRDSQPTRDPEAHSVDYAKELLRKKSSNYFEQISETKTVKVRLERQGRFEMGLWERTGMILFAIFLAWGTTWFALSEVENRFADKLEKRLVGKGKNIGTPAEFSSQNSWSLHELGPILSSKGIMESDTTWNITGSFQRIVNDGLPQNTEDLSTWKIESSHTLEWSDQVKSEHVFLYPSDPVYVETYRFDGKWSPINPHQVKIFNLGYPGL